MSWGSPVLRSWGGLLGIVMLLSGCAITGSTLAQDVAYERWEKCKSVHPQVTLKEITPDGQIWFWHGDTGQAAQEVRECLQKVEAQQGRLSSEAVTAPLEGPGQGSRSGSVQAPLTRGRDNNWWMSVAPLPAWAPGDEWAFRNEERSGTATFVWQVDRVEKLDGIEHYVVKAGAAEMFWRVSDLAVGLEKMSGEVSARLTPHYKVISFPLYVGKQWEQRHTQERPVPPQTVDIANACRADGEEYVTVGAGTFRAIRVVCRNTRTDEVALRAWYASEVKLFARSEELAAGRKRTRELIAYRLKSRPQPLLQLPRLHQAQASGSTAEEPSSAPAATLDGELGVLDELKASGRVTEEEYRTLRLLLDEKYRSGSGQGK